MKIVLDIGCQGYGGPDDSIEVLIDRYRPDLLLGFDPQVEETSYFIQRGAPETFVQLSRKAAWTYNGTQFFSGAGPTAGIRGEGQTCLHAALVPCFDLAGLLKSFPESAEVIVKVDIEGGEYPLLKHLMENGAIRLANKWLVEWHTDEYTRGHSTYYDRGWYESGFPGLFEVWHDPLHARCCNAPSPELTRARELVIPF